MNTFLITIAVILVIVIILLVIYAGGFSVLADLFEALLDVILFWKDDE